MALTTYLISRASDHLTEKQIQLWLVLFRRLPRYQEYSLIYSDDIEQRLSAAEGTLKARMLNALMKEIDSLGTGEVQVRGDREGTWWSQTGERDALIDEALDVLYDDISTMVSPVNPNPSVTGYGALAAVGQRGTDIINNYCCNGCGCRWGWKGGRRTCGCR